jgi:hypothetical protein
VASETCPQDALSTTPQCAIEIRHHLGAPKRPTFVYRLLVCNSLATPSDQSPLSLGPSYSHSGILLGFSITSLLALYSFPSMDYSNQLLSFSPLEPKLFSETAVHCNIHSVLFAFLAPSHSSLWFWSLFYPFSSPLLSRLKIYLLPVFPAPARIKQAMAQVSRILFLLL